MTLLYIVFVRLAHMESKVETMLLCFNIVPYIIDFHQKISLSLPARCIHASLLISGLYAFLYSPPFAA